MAQLNFGLLNTNAPAEIGGAYARGQQEALHTRQQEATTQSAEFNLANLKREHEALDKLMTDITANGGPSDPMQAAQMMMDSKHPEWFKRGLEMKQSYIQLNNDRQAMGLPPLGAGRPAAAPAAAPGAPAQPAAAYSQNAPMNALGSGTFGMGAAPANAMAPNAQVNALAAQTPAAVAPDQNALIMQAKTKMLSSNAGVRDAGKIELQHLLTTNKPPSAVEEYRFAQSPEGGNYKGSFEAFKILHTPRTTTNVNVPVNVSTEKKYGERFGGLIADADAAKLTAAEKAPEMAANADRITSLIATGNVITGTGANARLQIAKALNLAGGNDSEKIRNTEVLISSLAETTLGAIKSSNLGAGQGFTNADRDFLEKAKAGQLTYDSKSLTELARLSRLAAEKSADVWNTRVKQIPKSALEGTGISTEPVAISPRQQKISSVMNIPAGAINDLKSGRGSAEQFDAIFGPGSAGRILGKGN
jgi:hypothetical protein